MAKILDVYFYEKLTGQLEQDIHGDLNFTYAASWLADPEAVAISCSLPLQSEKFTRKKCNPFFEGLLPEENQRKLIARNLGISDKNDFSMLEKIGGECAGALSFFPSGKSIIPSEDQYHELSDLELPSILRELPARPLLAGEKDIRLSLAGVQDKLAVYVKNNKIYLPLNGAPSTHILKPDFTFYEGVIFNEAFCLKLAKNIGLLVAEADLRKSENIHFLLIKRYDRVLNSNNPEKIMRLHQEDFCQALAVSSRNKYQNEGGPSLKQCFDLIRAQSSRPVVDLERMVNAVIFNYLIGNCDAHGKNFSFLYLDGVQLAPLYDLICTLCYEELDKKMAMKLGGEYNINKISMQNFDKLAEEIQFAKPALRKRIVELADKVLLALPSIEIEYSRQEKVAALIEARARDLLVF